MFASHKGLASTTSTTDLFQRVHAANAQSARTDLVGHLRTQCNNNPATSTSPSTNAPTVTPASNPTTKHVAITGDHTVDASSLSTAGTILPAQTPALLTTTNLTNITLSPTPTTDETPSDVPSTTTFNPTTTTTTTNTDWISTCVHCDRTFTSRIGLVGHMRVHRTETGEPVPEAPIYSHRIRLDCPSRPRRFTHRMSLFDYMRLLGNLR
ncbi:hypothetical protein SprV_0301221600 [Sparganum proliferum]